jgi:hypothetical protein
MNIVVAMTGMLGDLGRVRGRGGDGDDHARHPVGMAC